MLSLPDVNPLKNEFVELVTFLHKRTAVVAVSASRFVELIVKVPALTPSEMLVEFV